MQYSDVTYASWRHRSSTIRLFGKQIVETNNKEDIKGIVIRKMFPWHHRSKIEVIKGQIHFFQSLFGIGRLRNVFTEQMILIEMNNDIYWDITMIDNKILISLPIPISFSWQIYVRGHIFIIARQTIKHHIRVNQHHRYYWRASKAWNTRYCLTQWT